MFTQSDTPAQTLDPIPASDQNSKATLDTTNDTQASCPRAQLTICLRKDQPGSLSSVALKKIDVVATYSHQVWHVNVSEKSLCNGLYRMVTVFDEFSNTALGVSVTKRVDSKEIISVLRTLIQTYGAPQFVRLNLGTSNDTPA